MASSIRKPVLIIVSILLFTGCANGNREGAISGVNFTTAITKPTSKTYTFQSTLEAKDNVRLAAQVVGRIRSIDVQEGGQVQKGQILYTLEQIYEKKLKEAQAAKNGILIIALANQYKEKGLQLADAIQQRLPDVYGQF